MKTSLKLLGIIALGLIGLTSIVSAQVGDYDGCGMMNWMGGGVGIGIFAFITWILFIAVLVLAIIWLVKHIERKK
jgi:uncharacterized membrane protein